VHEDHLPGENGCWCGIRGEARILGDESGAEEETGGKTARLHLTARNRVGTGGWSRLLLSVFLGKRGVSCCLNFGWWLFEAVLKPLTARKAYGVWTRA